MHNYILFAFVYIFFPSAWNKTQFIICDVQKYHFVKFASPLMEGRKHL